MLLSRDLEPMAMRGVAVIDRNAEAQARLVDDILDASRIITGKLRIELRVFDLVQITREAIEVVRPSSMAKKIELALTSSDETCPMVGDPERIRQVAWNLLSNAVKFTEAGGRVTARVEREGSRRPRSCVWKTRDGASRRPSSPSSSIGSSRRRARPPVASAASASVSRSSATSSSSMAGAFPRRASSERAPPSW